MKKLIKKYGGKLVKYKELPRHFQKALSLYMSVDGDAWDFPNDKWQDHPTLQKDNRTDEELEKYDKYLLRVLSRNIKSHYVKRYGDYSIGVVEIPTLVLTQAIVDSGHLPPEVNSIDKYKMWASKNVNLPNHPKINRWPVILESEDIISDGWHRFKCYLLRGDKTVPCIYYKEATWK